MSQRTWAKLVFGCSSLFFLLVCCDIVSGADSLETATALQLPTRPAVGANEYTTTASGVRLPVSNAVSNAPVVSNVAVANPKSIMNGQISPITAPPAPGIGTNLPANPNTTIYSDTNSGVALRTSPALAALHSPEDIAGAYAANAVGSEASVLSDDPLAMPNSDLRAASGAETPTNVPANAANTSAFEPIKVAESAPQVNQTNNSTTAAASNIGVPMQPISDNSKQPGTYVLSASSTSEPAPFAPTGSYAALSQELQTLRQQQQGVGTAQANNSGVATSSTDNPDLRAALGSNNVKGRYAPYRANSTAANYTKYNKDTDANKMLAVSGSDNSPTTTSTSSKSADSVIVTPNYPANVPVTIQKVEPTESKNVLVSSSDKSPDKPIRAKRVRTEKVDKATDKAVAQSKDNTSFDPSKITPAVDTSAAKAEWEKPKTALALGSDSRLDRNVSEPYIGYDSNCTPISCDVETLASMKKNACLTIGGDVRIDMQYVNRDNYTGESLDSTSFTTGRAELDLTFNATTDTKLFIKLALDDMFGNDRYADDLLQEVWFSWQNIACTPISLRFGRGEVAYGLDKLEHSALSILPSYHHNDSTGSVLYDSPDLYPGQTSAWGNPILPVADAAHPGLTDRRFLIEASVNFRDIATVYATLFQNTTGMAGDKANDNLLFQSFALKAEVTPLEWLDFQVSYMQQHNESGDDPRWYVATGKETQRAISVGFDANLGNLPLAIFGEYQHGWNWDYNDDYSVDIYQLGAVISPTAALDIILLGEFMDIDNDSNYLRNIDDSEHYWKAQIGLKYTFASGIYVMAEYAHEWYLNNNSSRRREGDSLAARVGWRF